MLSMSMIKDLNVGTDSSNPSDLLDVSGTLYFAASDASTGRELWRSDGSVVGTFRVADIVPGSGSSNPLPLAALGGNRLLLTVDGTSLWVSDGTAAGTQKVGDVVPDTYSPKGVAGGRMFFTANSPTTGQELWTSDGTPQGTHLVKDIYPGTNRSSVDGPFAALGGIAYFSADDGVHGPELWRSNGTDAGTYMVKDISPSTSFASFRGLATLGNSIYFMSPSSFSGWDLWKSNGTTNGTVLAIQMNLENPGPLYAVGNSLYFFNNTSQLFRSDGTTGGTAAVTTSIDPSGPIYDLHGIACYTVGNALWRSDATVAGTYLVQTSQFAIYNGVSTPTALYYIAADNGGYNPKLWRSDGTTAGSFVVDAPSLSQPAHLYPTALVSSGGKVFFSGYRADVSTELFAVSPGASAAALVKDINTSMPFGSEPIVYRTVGSYTYFLTRQDNQYDNYLLWRTDGTGAGTVFLADTGFNGAGIRALDAQPFGNSVLIKIGGRLLLTDPQPLTQRTLFQADTYYYLSSPVVLGNKIYFAATGPAPTYTNQIWVSDGQTTSLLQMPPGGFTLNGLGNLTVAGGVLYFSAADAGNNVELWRTDGTAAGTYIVKDINPGSSGSYPGGMWDVAGQLYFLATEADGKRRLWKSDGTGARTVPAAPSLTVYNDSNGFTPVGVMGGSLYLPATLDGGTTGVELWRTDGTPAGTRLVKDLNPGLSGINIAEFETVGSQLYFSALNQLYVTDGTDAGTRALAPELSQNTTPELGYSYRGPQQLTAVGPLLYFVAGDDIRGIELCRSDGTPGGTVMVQDLYPGYTGGLYHGGVYLKGVTTMAALGDTVIFGASDGVHGWEPWKAHYDGEPIADAGDGYQVLEGQSVTLSGAASRPGARPIVSYEWDLDFRSAADGFHTDAVGVTASLGNLDGPATYTVALRVTNDLGVTSIDTARINVVNVAPSLAISGPATPVAEGSAYTLSLAVLGDPGADTIKSWQIYWGDGTSQTISGNPSSVNHVYANGPFSYAVAASATDEDGTYTTRGLRVGMSDPAFGNGGVIVNAGSHADARVAVQSDGRIVAVGGQSDFEIDRYLANGTLDPSFGINGHATLDVTDGGLERASAVAILSDGRIVVGGTASGGTNYDWVLARFLADGTPDPSFGVGGKVWFDLGALGGNDLRDLILLPGGLILAAGNVNEGPANGGINFAALRLAANGTLDPTFGVGGIRTIDFGGGDDRAFGIARQSSGKIVLGGTANFGTTTAHFALARLTPSGQLDAGHAGTPFATGKLSPAIARYPRAQAIAMSIQGDDKIVLAGGGFDTNQRFEYAVVRYTAEGAFDNTFGNNGGSKDAVWSVDPYNAGQITGLALTPSGKIAFVGPYYFGSFVSGTQIGALTPTGGSDVTFGPGGGIIGGIYSIDLAPGIDAPGALAVAPDGNLILLAAGEKGAVLTRLASEPTDVTVNVTNVPPTNADIGVDRTVNEGAKVSMSATFTDPGVDPWVYKWHVTSTNGQIIADGTAKTFDFTPADNGLYTIQFTVTDDGGGSSSDTAVVTVNNLPPTVELGNARTTTEGAPFSLTGVEADPGSADVLTRHWTIQYPNGSIVDGGTLPTLTFTPPDNGIYTVSIVLSDDDGATATDSVVVTANNVAPTVIPTLPTAVFPGATFDLTLTVTDPGQDAISKLVINWGDGRSTTLVAPGTVQQSYATVGRYTISVTPTDEDGTYAATTRTILVTPRPTLNSGVLTINGTAFADTVLVTAGGGALVVSINGLITSYNLSDVTQVAANLLDGDDAMTYAGAVPTGTIDLGLGNDTFTLDSGDTAAPVTVLGNSGNDTLRINPAAGRPVNFNGGTGTDTLVLYGTDGDDTITLTNIASTLTGGGIANAKAISMTAVENRSVLAGAGKDTFSLTDQGGTAVIDTLGGGDGDDRFIIGDPAIVNAWGHNETLGGDAGNDNVIYNDQKNTQWLDYVVSDIWMQRSNWGFNTSGIESTTLNTGTGADRINVTPSTTMSLTVNAGNPGLTAPADRLGLPTSTTGAILNLTGIDSGNYTFADGRLPIRFTGIEQLSPPDTTRPKVNTAAFHPGGRPSLEINFSENVMGGVDLADLQVTNLATGQLLPASAFFVNVSGSLIINTSASWLPLGTLADGNYRARIPAASMMDPSGNTMLADFTLDFFVMAGDANSDRVVDFLDLARLAQNYNINGGMTWAQGDFNGDGNVDFLDLAKLAQNYNTALPGAGVPSATANFSSDLAAAFKLAAPTPPVTVTPTPTLITPRPPASKPKPTPIVRPPVAKVPAPARAAPPVSKAISPLRVAPPVFGNKPIKPRRDVQTLFV
jgi:uncharacterized delta-60 repeat protein